jgi:hypothetical protein
MVAGALPNFQSGHGLSFKILLHQIHIPLKNLMDGKVRLNDSINFAIMTIGCKTFWYQLGSDNFFVVPKIRYNQHKVISKMPQPSLKSHLKSNQSVSIEKRQSYPCNILV